MWFFIILAMMLAAGTGIVYLTSRFYKFAYVSKWGGGRKPVCLLLAALPVVLLTVVSWLALGRMNTMVILIHFLIIWFLCDLAGMLIQKKRKKEWEHYYVGGAAIGIAVLYLAAGWYLANHVWGTVYELKTEKETGNIRIAQIADSHVGTTFDGAGFAKWLGEIEKENPDVLVVTGDFVDDDTSKGDMIAACEALGRVRTTYGVYFAFGNHDKGYYAGRRGYTGDDLAEQLTKNGVHVLQDEYVLIDNRFYIIGRKDRSEESRGGSRLPMNGLVSGLDPAKYMIVLDHQPHDYDAQEAAGVDLVLSGHTHGGQFIPINYVGEWTGENEKTYGLEERGNTNFIVTSGISDWALDFKTGCKSEYVIVDIKGKMLETDEKLMYDKK